MDISLESAAKVVSAVYCRPLGWHLTYAASVIFASLPSEVAWLIQPIASRIKSAMKQQHSPFPNWLFTAGLPHNKQIRHK